GHVDVHVTVLVEARVDPVGARPAPDDADRGLDRLLHHVAELAGVDLLALALDGDSLDGQKVAADFGPGEPGDLADAAHLLRLAVAVLLDPEILLEVAAVYGHLLLVGIEQQL